jgi:long-chain acyl-CoA synthetase
VNKDRFSKADSVGLPMPGTEIRIEDPDSKGVGEILCKGPSVMLGYYENPEETAKVLKDGWLHTGDYGYFDNEGFLYISGRKKSVIVTKNGKNIFPEELEYYLMESEYIEEALVYGESDKEGDAVVKAVIYPNFELVNETLDDESNESLRNFFKEVIEDINEEMPIYKRIKRFAVRKTEFEKTTTRKIKRFAQENFQADC